MAIGITEEHEELRQAVRRFVDDAHPARSVRAAVVDGATRDRPDVLGRDRANRAGSACTSPKRTAGAGYGLVEQAVVVEELGRGVRARARTSRPCWPRRSLQDGGWAAAAALLPKLATGELHRRASRSTERDRCSAASYADVIVCEVDGAWFALDAAAVARDGVARASISLGASRSSTSTVSRRPPIAGSGSRLRTRVRDIAAVLLRGRGDRHRAVVRRHRGRVREGPRAVRPPDRPVPRREAPVRRHAGAHRARARRGVGRGARGRTTLDNGAGARDRGGGRARVRRRVPRTARTACRRSAASASRGSTTRTSTSGAR